ncbi:LysR family transcriptional regulator, partial [Pseudomonas syringae pv. actinidiae ICMP 18807]
DRHVQSGALVPACNASVGAVGGYYLLTPSGKMPRRAARAFEKWLSDEITP